MHSFLGYLRKKYSESNMFADWGKHLCKVNTFSLHKSFGYQSGFITFNVTLGISFDLENPLDWYRLDARW